MADDFDPLTIPAVMPASVARTKEDGTPTQHAVKWEEGLQAWMKANVANTNTRLNLVSDEVDGAYAAISTEATTRATADSALASQITTVQANVDTVAASVVSEATARSTADSALATSITAVDAKANNATASGQVYLTAMAGPGGAAAAYGWHLTASGAYAGMQALALSGGGSAIGFSASKFLFTDSGTAQNVFTYSGGKFRFTGDVAIDGNLAINGSFTAQAVASGFSARGSTGGTQALSAGTSSWSDLAAPLTLTVTPDAVTGDSYPLVYIRDSSFANAGGFIGAATVRIRLLINGVNVYEREIYSTTLSASGQIADGITDFFDTASAGGSQTFQLQYQHNFGTGITGTVFAKVMVLMISR